MWGAGEDLANLADEDPLLLAVGRWKTLRKFTPNLIEMPESRAAREGDRMLAAPKLLAGLNRSGKRRRQSRHAVQRYKR